jgi:hypothetical protein
MGYFFKTSMVLIPDVPVQSDHKVEDPTGSGSAWLVRNNVEKSVVVHCAVSLSSVPCFTSQCWDEFLPDPGSGPFFDEIFLHYLQNPCYVIFFKLGYS